MKKTIAFLISVLLILSMTVTVFAEITKTDAGTVTFNGSKLKSSFSSGKLAASVSEMQPGDSVIFSVKISNKGDFTTDWYMSNKVISSLEDAQSVAENGGYSYKLTYISEAGNKTVLYDSDSVGGEKDSDAGAGLNEVTDSLDEFFYLDRLDEGGAGTVKLTVRLDGESQGNIYQDTLAKLKMNFAVEKAEGDTPSEHPDTSIKIHDRVKTGDVWTGGAIAALTAGLFLLGLGIWYKKKKEVQES